MLATYQVCLEPIDIRGAMVTALVPSSINYYCISTVMMILNASEYNLLGSLELGQSHRFQSLVKRSTAILQNSWV